MRLRPGFTLIEVMIAVMLLMFIIPALFEVTDLMRRSNKQLEEHFKKNRRHVQAVVTLYDDILSSDGNLTIRKDSFDRLCMTHTRNTLYNMSDPTVCWGVSKSSKSLMRLEGVTLPLKFDERSVAYADEVIKNVTLFEISYDRSDVIVALEAKGMEPIAFAVYGIKPARRIKPKKPRRHPKKRRTGPKRPPRPSLE